jgi:uncharacterized protein (TIGR01777 family)
MDVLVTGATGFLGRAVCARLRGAGHGVLALSRDPQRAQRDVPGVQRAWRWDPKAGRPPQEALQSADAVVHLAGESVAGRWTAARKQEIRDSRVLGTRNLVTGLAGAGGAGGASSAGGASAAQPRASVLVCASAIGYYGDRGEAELVESSEPGSDFLAQLCRDWEAEAVAAQALGLRVVRLRFGIVVGPDGGALQAMLPPFRLGAGGPLGSGRQWWSWVHRDDVTGLALRSLGESWSGAINATAPEAARQGDFARALGRVLGRPAVLPAPALALKLLLGEFSTELLSSKKVLPQRATQLGYTFAHPALEPALRAALGR